MWKLRPPLELPLASKYKSVIETLSRDTGTVIKISRLSAEEEFPELHRNYTLMARVLTVPMYKRLCQKVTESGFTFDDVIQPGLEDPGDPARVTVGCVAGDAESYNLFCEFFDCIIKLCHHGFQMTQSQKSNFNLHNLKGAETLDGDYVLSCEMQICRNVEGFSFPTHCSRGERRQLQSLAKQAFTKMDTAFPGKYWPLHELAQEATDPGVNDCIASGPSVMMMRTGVARDWPDARGVWISQNETVYIWVNMEEHLQITSKQEDGSIKEAFGLAINVVRKLGEMYKELKHPFIWKDHLGYVLSSPAVVGTGLKATVQVKLNHISKHPKFEDILSRLCLGASGSGVCTIFNKRTAGVTEVELLQLVVDGIKLLIDMDKSLGLGEAIDCLYPTQK
ncbi:zgc:172076 [Polypterus senegalus]|uniref:zgc:172076 n=1 Tax=Polypterus senegalus TaxID=55291 RepID=UPI0019660AA9|nr:zgc:172076 [Polypterus senegalus]